MPYKSMEVQEAFNMTDFPVLDAFHVFYLRKISEAVSPTYDIEELIYRFCGEHQVSIF